VHGEVLQYQEPHRFPLPEKQEVSENKFDGRLEVKCDQHQPKNHAQQNGEENVQDQSKVQGQKSKRKQVVNPSRVKHTD